jgi:aspartate/methionine/tyrosine aminotransferase
MVEIAPFKLERYFARYEFEAPYMLSASDCESLSMADLLALADKEGLELWEKMALGYTESAGHPVLRAEIAGLYYSLIPDQVLVLAPEEGIFIAMQTLLSPGDEVVVLFPAYQSLMEVARSIGCRVIPWMLEIGPDGWRLDLTQLEHSITDKTRLLVINFPNNPTGYLPKNTELEEIIEIARRHHLTVFSDEMYRLLEYDPGCRLPPVCDQYEKGISLSGMSKAFGLPGLRIGWLATRSRDLMDRFSQFKDYTTICSSAPSEVLAIIGLRARDTILARNLAIVKGNLSLAEKFCQENSRYFRWHPPLGGSVAFPEWIGEGTVDDFCQSMVEREGVMVVPGSMFDHPGQHFRVGLGRKNFPKALERVKNFIS